MNRIFIKSLITFIGLFCCTIANNCTLPKGCFIQRIKYDANEFTNEKNIFLTKYDAVKCMVKNAAYKFEFDDLILPRTCLINEFSDRSEERVIIEWPRKSFSILDKHFDLPNLLYYLEYFIMYSDLYIVNLKGIAIDLNATNSAIIPNNPSTTKLYCVGCKMDFYTNENKLIKSCADIIKSNSTILSFFQIKVMDIKAIVLDYCNYPNEMCPLVFKNIDTDSLALTGLVDSFYKKNTLKFSNDVFDDLNSTIFYVQLSKIENIKIDTNLLNPSVFKYLNILRIYGPVKSVDKSTISTFKYLSNIKFANIFFRKLVHENGIDWINEINKDMEPLDLKNLTEFRIAVENRIYILISIFGWRPDGVISLSQVFPDEDFCIYKDFPFDRLVVLMQHFESNSDNSYIQLREFTCTYLWLCQYLPLYYQIIPNTNANYLNIKLVIEAEEYKNIDNCNFDKRLELCNKTDFKIKDIWSSIDYTLLNKKIQTAIKVSSYLFSFLGLITNMLVIVVIAKKDNSDLFKEFKQYSYLCINSVFCIMILVINILSWMTECFYPFEVFCPEIRKVAFIQFFKIIFKECLTTTFRFMLNFSYVAFAFNRIGVISKDKNKLVKFMCDIGIKKYIAFCLFISASLSAMNFFKYEVNYDYPFMNYPISNEWDIFNNGILRKIHKKSQIFNDALLIVNTISYIINYVLFVLICVIIDIYMVVHLRNVLADKMQKMEKLFAGSNKSKLESVRKENQDAENKAIQMVVINTAIGILFKMPVSFIPIINVYAEFYYKNYNNQFKQPEFGQFYSSLFQNGFYSQISDLADLFFVISISIQLFIYKRFDKKIQIALDRLKLNGINI